MKNTTVPSAPAAVSSYEQTALDFLAKHGIAFRAVLAKVQKAPGYADGDNAHGLHYRITLSSPSIVMHEAEIVTGLGIPVHVDTSAFSLAQCKAKTARVFSESPGSKGDGWKVVRYKSEVYTSGRRITFDFWNSVRAKQTGEVPTAYGVLACISGDVNCPETFADFCGEYGYSEDSRAAHATFKRCSTLARRLRAFFSADEIEGLSEIQ